MGVGGYDGMAAIAEVAKKLGPRRQIDGDKAMEILKGMKLLSPRGPISIDPATSDIESRPYTSGKVEKRVAGVHVGTSSSTSTRRARSRKINGGPDSNFVMRIG
jgi:hypothetical protein